MKVKGFPVILAIFTCLLPLSTPFLLPIQSLLQLQLLQKEWEPLRTNVISKWKRMIPSRMPEERPREEEALINLAASTGESSLIDGSEPTFEQQLLLNHL